MVWIPIAVMVLSLVQWMITGECEAVAGILGIFACLALGFLALRPPAPIYSPVCFVVALGTAVAYPFVRTAMHVREARQFEVDQLAAAYDNLAQRPRDVMAKFRIARHMETLGYPGAALRIAEPLLSELTPSVFVDEHRFVRRLRDMNLPARAFAPIPCPDCGFANSSERIHCERCGAPFLKLKFAGAILPPGRGRWLVMAWVMAVAIMLVSPMIFLLPAGQAAAAGIGLLAMVGGLAVWTFRDRDEAASA